MVQMVGPAHVGIGLDVIFDARELNAYIASRPDEWPMAKDPNWTGFRTVLPEQIAELASLMGASGYPEVAIRQILGGNYLRIAKEIWVN